MIVRRWTNRRANNPSSTTASRISSPSTASRTNSLIWGTRTMLWSSSPISTAPKKLPTIVPGATERADPADDRSGDRLQLETLSGGHGERAEAGEHEEPSEAGERSTRREGGDRRAPHRQAGLHVRPPGWSRSRTGSAQPGRRARSSWRTRITDDRYHEHRAELVVADAEHRRSREVNEPLRQRAGGDRACLGVADQPRPIDRQRTERDDDRRDPPVGDEERR